MNSYQVLFAAMVVVSLVRLPTRQLWWLKWSRHWLLYWWSIAHILCWMFFFLIQIFQPSYLDLTFALDLYVGSQQCFQLGLGLRASKTWFNK